MEIKAEDANGFVVRNYTTPSDFSLTGSSATTPAPTFSTTPSSISFKNGIAVFQVIFTIGTGTTSATETLTATDQAGGVNGAGVSDFATTTITTDSVAGYVVKMPSQVRAGQNVSVQVLAVDANGHTVGSYDNQANVTITGSNTTNESVTFTNGKATIPVVFLTSPQERREPLPSPTRPMFRSLLKATPASSAAVGVAAVGVAAVGAAGQAVAEQSAAVVDPAAAAPLR